MKEHSKHTKHKSMSDPNKYLLLTLTEENISEDEVGYETANLSEDDVVVVSSLDNQLTVVITDQMLADNTALGEAGIQVGDELQLVVPTNLASTEHPTLPPHRP